MLPEKKLSLANRGLPVTIPKTIAGRFSAPGPHSSLNFQTDYIAIQTLVFFVTEFTTVNICNEFFFDSNTPLLHVVLVPAVTMERFPYNPTHLLCMQQSHKFHTNSK